MIFGDVSVQDAEGAILAHTLRVGALVVQKGTHLTSEDIEALSQAGVAEVTVARLEADDVEESLAASTIAQALCGAGVSISPPQAGRCNLHAQATGPTLQVLYHVFTRRSYPTDILDGIDGATNE